MRGRSCVLCVQWDGIRTTPGPRIVSSVEKATTRRNRDLWCARNVQQEQYQVVKFTQLENKSFKVEGCMYSVLSVSACAFRRFLFISLWGYLAGEWAVKPIQLSKSYLASQVRTIVIMKEEWSHFIDAAVIVVLHTPLHLSLSVHVMLCGLKGWRLQNTLRHLVF